jgi:predicted MFS family arabinose efflux permease
VTFRLDARSRRAIAGFSVTQIVGWGTTYYVPSIFFRPMMRDLGLSHETIYAGVAVMLVLGAFAGPKAGAVMQQHGVRHVMTAGWLITAAALVLLAFSTGIVTYMLAWVLIGLASPFSMSQGALTGLAVVSGPAARRAIGLLMVASGLASTIFWPVAAALETWIGWRGACLVFALVHALVCAPIPWLVLKTPALRRGDEEAEEEPEPAPLLTPESRRLGFVLTAATFSLAGLVSWGLPLHLIAIFERMGQSTEAAVLLASLLGPAQLVARVFEIAVGHRVSILTTSLVSLVLMPVGVLLPLLLGYSTATALGLVAIYGVTTGLVSVARNVAPLALFGRGGYAIMLGRMALPQNLAFAASPLLFAIVISDLGTRTTLWLSIAPLVLAAVTMTMLWRLAR